MYFQNSSGCVRAALLTVLLIDRSTRPSVAADDLATAIRVSGFSGRAETAGRTSSNQAGLRTASVDDLVRRAHILSAALSPDGRYAAYLSLRGDPVNDRYSALLRVIDTSRKRQSFTLVQYELAPEEAFDELGWLSSRAGGVRWVSNDALLYIHRSGGKFGLFVWDARDLTVRAVLQGHDQLELGAPQQPASTAEVFAIDYINPPQRDPNTPPDYSWFMRKGYRFFRQFQNPKLGRFVRRQEFRFVYDGKRDQLIQGDRSETWESIPEEWKWFTRESMTADEETYLTDRVPSPDGSRVAAMELKFSGLTGPADARTSFRVVVVKDGQVRALTSDNSAFVLNYTRILGWSADGKSINYIHVGAAESVIYSISPDGKLAALFRESALLAQAQAPNVLCQCTSRDGRYALLVRQTNTQPDELVVIDLHNRREAVAENPNSNFPVKEISDVRLYDVEVRGNKSWARLYLPWKFRTGVRYPLIITQYMASPGFGADVGDEIPILPLTANGIAVLDMYSVVFNQASTTGDFRIQLARVKRPLEAMKAITRRLAEDGIIDPERIGLSGVSYGAEISMYAYWNWRHLRTVSIADPSWDPNLIVFGGVDYSEFLTKAGLPRWYDVEEWRRLAAGPNARPDMAPLLMQSPDGEETWTVPTWTELQRGGAAVEWLEYPNEGHVKRRPANKWWIFSRNLDWFCFWLKGEEHPGPGKEEQYSRWRLIRESRQ